MSSYLSQTLNGPTGFLSESLNESILPLHLSTLSASSGWQGFWSLLIAWEIIFPVSGCFFTMMPLESPTLEQNSFWPRVTKLTHVEPENLMSRFPAKRVSLQSRKALLKAMQISSVFRGSDFCVFFISSSYLFRTYLNSASKYYGSLFLRYVDTSLPHYPWPSQTEKKWQYLRPQKWGTVIQLSWFYLFGLDGAIPVLVANANLVTALVDIYLGLPPAKLNGFICS